MRVVIYDAEDMEPITVIKLDDRLVMRLRQDRELRIPVRLPMRSPTLEMTEARLAGPRYCCIRFEPIMKGEDFMMWICTTMDGESALLLRSVFLPGQQASVAREREDAFMQGLMVALDGT